MSRAIETKPPDAAKIEQSLAIVAYIVLRHGDKYVPLLDRLEHELGEARRRTSHRDRAERILSSLSVEVKSALVA